MKNSVKIMLAAAALLSAFSCTKEMAETSVAGLVPMTFEAGFGTKTALDANGKTNLWVAGDKVAVFDGTATQVFTAQSAGASTTLSGSVTEGATSFSAVYPYQEGIVFAADKITASIPARQKAVLGSFDPAAVLAVAKSSTQNFAFQNLVALVKVTITASNIESIAIKGHMNQDIAGTVEITMNEGVPAAVVTANGSKFAKVSNGDGSALEPGTYYVAVAAGEYAKGLSVILTDIDGKVAEKSGGAAATLARNTITSLGTISDACAPLANTYNWYNDGMDLLVGGVNYNKADYGEGTLIDAADTKISGSGVYFIEPTATATLGNTSSTFATKCLIIGTDPTKRPVVKMSNQQFWLGDGAELILANIEFNAVDLKTGSTPTATYPFPCNDNCTIKQMTFDNVWMKNAATKPMGSYLNAHKAIKNLSIVNSEYIVRGAGAMVINVGNSNDYFVMDRILVRNSVLYSRGDIANQCLILNAGTKATVNSVIMKNNTFININPVGNMANGFVYANTVWTADIQDNLVFYNKNYSYCASFMRISTDYPSAEKGETIIKHNLLYQTQTATDKLYFSIYFGKKAIGTEFEEITQTDTNPYEGGTFPADASARDASSLYVPVDAYKSYGAQR